MYFSGCIDIDEYHKEVINSFNFKKNPHKASKNVWEMHKKEADDNRAAMRTSILGVVDFNGLHTIESVN